MRLGTDMKEKIAEYVASGVFKREQIVKIFKAKDNEEILDAICSMYNWNREQKKDLWFHIIMSVWDKEDLDTCFNERESIFMKLLIENKGFLKKTDCRGVKVLSTDFKISATADALREMELIDCYTLSNREVVYVLNMNLYKEVFGNGKE